MGTPNDKVMASLEFVKNPKNTEAAVREIVTCATLRRARNASSHPFSPIASNAVRESALALYSSFLTHEFTEVLSSYYLNFSHIVIVLFFPRGLFLLLVYRSYFVTVRFKFSLSIFI